MEENKGEEHLDGLTNNQSDNLAEEVIPMGDNESTNQKKVNENMEVHHHPDLHHKPKKWKEYFLEFLMIFLAVTMGFFAESLREHIGNKEKEKKIIIGIIRDLKLDTASASSTIKLENDLLSDMRSALQIPTEKLQDINVQDTFYYHFLHILIYYWEFQRNDNTLVQLKNENGFNVIKHEGVADSVIALNNYYDFLKANNGFYHNDFLRVEDFTSKVIKVPVIPTDDNGYPILPGILNQTEVFTQYDKPLLEQLYSLIKIEKIELESVPKVNQVYKEKAERLLKFLQKEYQLD
ncbi:MAG: hypothetical protein ABIO32_08110 [Ferruginibacter sp.]